MKAPKIQKCSGNSSSVPGADFDRLIKLIDSCINNDLISIKTRLKWVELAQKEPLTALSILGSLIENNISVLTAELRKQHNLN